MARGTTLTALIENLRREIGSSADPSKGISAKDSLIDALNAEYSRLADDYNWPFLKHYEIKLTQAGSRYYNAPDEIPVENIKKVYIKYQDRWLPVNRGISLDNYNVYDSDDDERSDPVRAWDVYNSTQMEFWPLPQTNDLKVRIEGTRKITKMISGSDVCLLDDELVVLFAAAEILRKKKSKNADEKLSKAQRHYKTVKARIHGRSGFSMNKEQHTSNVTYRNIKYVGNA